MKDIEELMMEMENINKQVAAELSSDEKADLASLVTDDSSAPIIAAVASTCTASFSTTVDFCCTSIISNNVGTLVTPSAVNFIYNPNCLDATVERCTVPICNNPVINITVFRVKVVGCIPFAFSARDAIQGICGSAANARTDLCCQGSVCVNNAICCRQTLEAALNAADNIRGKLTCGVTGGITISGSPSIIEVTCTPGGGSPCNFNKCLDQTYVKFTAQLTLPSCPV